MIENRKQFENLNRKAVVFTRQSGTQDEFKTIKSAFGYESLHNNNDALLGVITHGSKSEQQPI